MSAEGAPVERGVNRLVVCFAIGGAAHDKLDLRGVGDGGVVGQGRGDD